MLRDLAIVLDELHDAVGGVAVQAFAQRAGVYIDNLELELPMDVVPVFRNGGCVLLADVARNQADSVWISERSRLHIVWQALPREAAP